MAIRWRIRGHIPIPASMPFSGTSPTSSVSGRAPIAGPSAPRLRPWPLSVPDDMCLRCRRGPPDRQCRTSASRGIAARSLIPIISRSFEPQPFALRPVPSAVKKRVLLLATTTGYQTRMFGEAAERVGVELVFATDRCDVLEDPWRDRAIPVRFHDEEASVDTILEHAAHQPISGVLVVGDRPTVVAAMTARELRIPAQLAPAAAVSRNK